MIVNKFFTINHAKITQETKIAVLSDIHFNKHIRNKMIQETLQNITEHQPDIIVIAGDIIHSTNELTKPATVKNLRSFLTDLTHIAPVVACYGNHDLIKLKKFKQLPISESILKDSTTSIPNFNLLYQSQVTIKGITFFDITLPVQYYVNKKTKEDLTLFKQYDDSRKRPNNDSFHVLLCHSPVYIHQMNLSKINLVISGHMHHGLVPNRLDKIWKSDRGIIGPHRQLFPRYTRGMMYYPTPHLISGGINKIVSPSTMLFSSHIEYIILKNKS